MKRLQLNLLTLAFNRDLQHLEQPFLDHYHHTTLPLTRIAAVLGGLLFFSFAMLDHVVVPQQKELFWLIRFGIVCPFFGAAFYLLYSHRFKNLLQAFMMMGVISSGIAVNLMIAVAPPQVGYVYYAGLILILIFGYTFIQLRFIWGAFSGWIIVAIYEITAIGYLDTPRTILISNNFFFITANLMGMVACYFMEYQARRGFFLTTLLEKEQHELARANHRIAAKINEMEREVARRREVEKDLILARDAAEKATRAKSEFLANMSHELRTPLNAIVGMADLLKTTSITPKQSEYLYIVHKASTALLALISDILDFSKIEAGKIEFTPRPFSIRDVITEVEDMFMGATVKKSIPLLTEIGEDVPETMVADPLRLRQVLVNLVANAYKFTERGEIRLSVRTQTADDEKIGLLFRVQDTGIGIDPDVLDTRKEDNIFEAFKQADGSPTRKYGGAGLGLAICRRIVEGMNGTIWVESRPGEGSTFYFTAAFGRSDSALPVSDMGPDPYPETFHFRGCLILLVEDDAINRIVAVEMLKGAGCRVETAVNGREAVAMAAEKGYDAVLMDMQMPEMGGLEATRIIRRELKKTIPIIAMTANVLPGDREKCLEAGMDDYLTKPMETQSLLKALGKWIPAGRSSSVE